MLTEHPSDQVAVWWAAEYIIICEEAGSPARGEFARRFRDQAKHLSPDNSVFGSARTPSNVDLEHAHLVPEKDWETGVDGDEADLTLS